MAVKMECADGIQEYIETLPEPETRNAAAHDGPRHAPFQQRIAEADGQHHQHLPCGQLRKCCGDLGPVVLEQQHDDAGECGEHQQRKRRFFLREGAAEGAGS